MLWLLILLPMLLLLTASAAHAEETSRYPDNLPYPADTIIPFLKLTDAEYGILCEIYRGLMACKAEIPLSSGATPEQIERIMNALHYDYPELVHYPGSYLYRYVGETPRRVTSVLPDYCLTKEETAAVWERITRIVNRVVTDCGATIAAPAHREPAAAKPAAARPATAKSTAAAPARTPAARSDRFRSIWLRPSETVMDITARSHVKPSLESIWLHGGDASERPKEEKRPVRPAPLSTKMKQIWVTAPRSTAAAAPSRPVAPTMSRMARTAEMLHDALVACTRYRSRKCGDPHVLSVKGALLDGLSNCVGYSKTLMLLYRTAGIPCGYVHGTTGEKRGGPPTHAWNIACIDGKCTQIDATWSDHDKEGYVTHFYYGLSDAQMQGDHAMSPEGCVPTCGDHVNWHRLHGCYVASQEEACDVIRACMRRKEKLISLRFSSDAAYKEICKDIPAFVRAYNAAAKVEDRISCTYCYTWKDPQRCLLLNLLTDKL